jgi:hypothetical protein
VVVAEESPVHLVEPEDHRLIRTFKLQHGLIARAFGDGEQREKYREDSGAAIHACERESG